MNNTTHTPGPWYPHYAKADHCLSSSVWGRESGNQVAVIGGKSLETMNANAALIAAAPAMYEALKAILDSENSTLGDGGSILGSDYRSLLQAVLAQAEGGGHE